MSDFATRLKYKHALILKHLLRDKSNRDADEEILFVKVTQDIEDFRKQYNITPNKRSEEKC